MNKSQSEETLFSFPQAEDIQSTFISFFTHLPLNLHRAILFICKWGMILVMICMYAKVFKNNGTLTDGVGLLGSYNLGFWKMYRSVFYFLLFFDLIFLALPMMVFSYFKKKFSLFRKVIKEWVLIYLFITFSFAITYLLVDFTFLILFMHAGLSGENADEVMRGFFSYF